VPAIVTGNGRCVQKLGGAGSIAALLTFVVLVAGAAVLAHPADRVADDIAAQRQLLHRQVEIAEHQLALQGRQVRLTTRSIRIQTETLDLSRRTSALTADLRDLATRTNALLTVATGDTTALRHLSARLAALSARLISLSTDIRRHVRNLDRKVP